MKEIPEPGDRIRLIAMPEDPNPIEAGSLGLVTEVEEHVIGCGNPRGSKAIAWYHISVRWDNGRTLAIVSPPDECEIISKSKGNSP